MSNKLINNEYIVNHEFWMSLLFMEFTWLEYIWN